MSTETPGGPPAPFRADAETQQRFEYVFADTLKQFRAEGFLDNALMLRAGLPILRGIIEHAARNLGCDVREQRAIVDALDKPVTPPPGQPVM